MYFNKIRHPANFVFAGRSQSKDAGWTLAGEHFRAAIEDLGGDVHRLRIEHPRWRPTDSQAELAARLDGDSEHTVEIGREGGLEIVDRRSGRKRLQGAPSATFGLSGDAWVLQFRHEGSMQFFGLGEHSKGLEKTGQRVKFWNTDVVSDYAWDLVVNGHPSPAYVSVPWLIIRREEGYVGILVHNPGAVFMDLASDFIWDGKNPEDRARKSFYLGAPGGAPELYFIVGPTLASLTRKLQTLVGRTPRPPVWALGHHQCRWGYAGPADLERLDRRFREHAIPCDGLWLDIDYMDAYKVFTFAPALWTKGAKSPKRVLASLARRGRRVVPILDPGVKVKPGYPVYDEGIRDGIFCLSPAGKPYVGFVWPGQTHFPDFSLAEARQWWAGHVRRFAELGVGGAWLDMNDPAVGSVELDDMLFDHGTKPHESFHNQYALGMARATRAGFLEARPNERPFLVSRSACISSSRYAAVWTGDNHSNWHHLRLSIPTSLSLALSGIPFNAPDVVGFSGDANAALAIAWYKAGFLYPFLRNHTVTGSRPQEPWAFGAAPMRIIRHYIRLRYKLLPYLYQLFVEQEETGEAMLRPMLYDFEDASLSKVSDQFMVGPSILQAPVVEEGEEMRRVMLPGTVKWFSAQEGRWLKGGRRVSVRAAGGETPLYVREGSLIPMQVGERTSPANDLADIELHCFLTCDSKRPSSTLRYVCDDGSSFDYQKGVRTEVTIVASVGPGRILRLACTVNASAFRPLRMRVLAYDRFNQVEVTVSEKSRRLALAPSSWRFTGKALKVLKSAPFVLGAKNP